MSNNPTKIMTNQPDEMKPNEAVNPPERIYLQWHGCGENDGSPVMIDDVTYSLERVFSNDVVYIQEPPAKDSQQ